MACAGADKARSTPASEESEDTLWKVSSGLSDANFETASPEPTIQRVHSWGSGGLVDPMVFLSWYPMVAHLSHGLGRAGVNRGGAQHTL